MNCNCIKKTNEALAEHNTELDTSIAINPVKLGISAVLLVPTRKIHGKIRKGPLKLNPNYCPLCGEKQEPAEQS